MKVSDVSRKYCCLQWGLNSWPLVYKTNALPLSYRGLHWCVRRLLLTLIYRTADFTFYQPMVSCCADRGSHTAGASIAQWQSVGLVNQRSWVQSSLEASFLDKSVTVRMWEKDFDPDVIRTRSLLIWSQTRYRCATESSCVRSYRDLNSDRWIQSPEC